MGKVSGKIKEDKCKECGKGRSEGKVIVNFLGLKFCKGCIDDSWRYRHRGA